MGGLTFWCAIITEGGAFFDWMSWIWRVRDLASSFPKEEEQRVVGLQWWRRYDVWVV